MVLTRREALAKLISIEEKHKQDRDSFWLNNVKGDEPWLLEIRQGLLKKESLKVSKYHLPVDLTKEAFINEIKNFQQKSNIRRKYHFESYAELIALFKKYGLEELYKDYQEKRQWLVFKDKKTGQIKISNKLDFACEVKSKVKAREIVKGGSYGNYEVSRYPDWIRKKRKEHEMLEK